MPVANRFRDEKKLISDYYREVWVVCPACSSKAVASADHENRTVRLVCTHCGYNKDQSTMLDRRAALVTAAHVYFGAVLWLKATFRQKEIVWAYNPAHLEYLERYIAAGLREHPDRTHYTLLEKLPLFYHEAKNRGDLLKLIGKMKRELI